MEMLSGKGSSVSSCSIQDNKINMPRYGLKGREVLPGKKVDAASVPAGIPAFQEALQKYYGKRRRCQQGLGVNPRGG
jgi:hypothetical protein